VTQIKTVNFRVR